MALLVYSVKKQFNTSASLGQYEFLVKWYSAKRDTWELITNIPDAVLNKFEQEKQTPVLTPLEQDLGYVIDKLSIIQTLYQIHN